MVQNSLYLNYSKGNKYIMRDFINILEDKQLKKEFILEGADVLQNLFLLCQNEGIEFLELVDGLEEKNKKWRKQLLKELNKKNAKVKTNTR